MNKVAQNIGILSFCLLSVLLISCNDDETNETPNQNNKRDNPEKGRFDNSSFAWDVVSAPKHSSDQIYIGDLSVQIVEDGPDDKIILANPSEVYLGAVFPESSYSGSFDKEVSFPKNPIDIVYDFKDPFIDGMTKEIGSAGYKTSLKKALKSIEYERHLSADRESLEYYCTEFSSYKDVEKAFIGNHPGLGKALGSYIENKGIDTKKKGRLFAKLVSRNFNVYMDTPTHGIFKDPIFNRHDGNSEKLVYIKSLTYGKVVYLVIESGYSYPEVKDALETGLKYRFSDAGMKSDQKTAEVFSESNITIFTTSGINSSLNFKDDPSILSSLFSVKYSNLDYGIPIYLQGRYVHDNSVYTVSKEPLR